MVRQVITTPLFSGVKATMNAISKNSKNPERALMLLDVVNTDKELYQLLSYGIKGKHYNEENGYLKPIKDTAYKGTFWIFGNPNLALLVDGQPRDIVEQIKSYNENVEIPPLFNFHFDDSKLKTEMAAVTAVEVEYGITLDTGTVDPSVVLPKFLDALKKAGIDKIKAEFERQLADWTAKNGKK